MANYRHIDTETAEKLQNDMPFFFIRSEGKELDKGSDATAFSSSIRNKLDSGVYEYLEVLLGRNYNQARNGMRYLVKDIWSSEEMEYATQNWTAPIRSNHTNGLSGLDNIEMLIESKLATERAKYEAQRVEDLFKSKSEMLEMLYKMKEQELINREKAIEEKENQTPWQQLGEGVLNGLKTLASGYLAPSKPLSGVVEQNEKPKVSPVKFHINNSQVHLPVKSETPAPPPEPPKIDPLAVIMSQYGLTRDAAERFARLMEEANADPTLIDDLEETAFNDENAQ